jgi:uncharacterized membrane protein YqjE
MSAQLPPEDAGRPGLFAALKNILATLLSIGRTRAELLAVEIEEEKYRLIAMWAKAIGAAFLIALGVIMAVFSLALAFWEQRVLVFGLFAVLFLGVAALLVLSLRQQAKAPSRLFRSSLAELDADIAQLRGSARE